MGRGYAQVCVIVLGHDHGFPMERLFLIRACSCWGGQHASSPHGGFPAQSPTWMRFGYLVWT
jgi:hypothetical protein